MEYVRHLYTEEELKTLFKWFDAQVLPDTMQLDNATYIPDVRETLSRLKDQAVLCRENPKMQGCIILLERIFFIFLCFHLGFFRIVRIDVIDRS